MSLRRKVAATASAGSSRALWRGGRWAVAVALLASGCVDPLRLDLTGAAGSGSAEGCPTRCEGSRPLCSASLGTCVECTSDEQCGGRRCAKDSGHCVECLADGDCDGALTCDPASHGCVSRCSRDEDDCPGDRVCDVVRELCVQCQSDSDCSGAERCRLAQQVCVECVADSDCAGAKSHCDAYFGRCVACLSRADCGADNVVCTSSGDCKPCSGQECAGAY